MEQGVIDINKAIVAAGGTSIVISGGGKRAAEIAAAGGLHIQLPVNTKNPLKMWRNIGLIKKALRAHNVNILHACSRAPAWSAQFAVKGTAARYVTSCHSAHSISGALKRFYNSSITKGERVIAVSRFLEKYLADNYSIDPAIIRVIHRGVEIEKFDPALVDAAKVAATLKSLGIPDGAKVILLPARITRSKGHKVLIDAIQQLGRTDVIGVLLGSDIGFENYRQELDEYIREKGMGDYIRIASNIDMPLAYMMATIVAAPSTVPEGFGRAPIEAQAMGRPVITAAHGGMMETVVPGETGWLVEPGSAASLAEALKTALALPADVQSGLAARLRDYARQNFTNERMGKATLAVYAELL